MTKPVFVVMLICGLPTAAAVAFMEGLGWLGVLLIAAESAAFRLPLHGLQQTAAERKGRPPAGLDDERVAVAAAEYRLGDFVGLFRTEWSVPGDKATELLPCYFLLVVLGMPLASAVAVARHLVWLGMLAIPAAVGAGRLMMLVLHRQGERCLLHYEQGFVCRSERAVHAFHWHDIAAVDEIVKQDPQNGRHLYHYDLRSTDGRQARLSGKEFGSVVLGKVATEVSGRPVTARSAVGCVPWRVAELADGLGLGKLHGSQTRQHRTVDVLLNLTGTIALIFLMAMAIGGATIDHDYGPAAAVGGVALLVAVATWGGLPAMRAAQAGRGADTCYVYAGGLVVTGRLGRVRACVAWGDIACVYRQKAGTYYVLRPGLRAIKSGISDALGRELLRLHAGVILPGVVRRLRAGETLRFGPFLAAPAGVTLESETIPWEEITGCESGRDFIGIDREGRPAVRMAQQYVPDLLVFEQLVKAFAGHRWEAPLPCREAAPGRGDGHTVRGGRWERCLEFLTPLAISRVGIALGGGIGIAVAVAIGRAITREPGGQVSLALVAGVIDFLLIAPIGYVVVTASLRAVVRFLTSSLAAGRPSSPRRSLAAAAIAVMGTILWRPDPALGGLADAALTGLPAALVLALGVWAYSLTQRRVRSSRHRRLRHAADLLVAVPVGIGIPMLFDRGLLAHQPAAAVLFPLGAGCAMWIWRAMCHSGRLAVRAGADIVLSLLLGTDLVLFLVWGANLLGLNETEVAFVRGALERAGSIVDLRWWLWATLFVLLAGASLAFARWPARLSKAIRWSERLPVVASIDVGRRLLTGVHIGLLTVVLIGLSAPASLGATLQRQIRTGYTVALQRELEGDGERAPYTAIHRRFTPGHGAMPTVTTLTAIVGQIHRISSPPPGDGDATAVEDDLARRVGRIQAAALGLSAPRSVPAAASAEAARAGFDLPIRDAGDVRERLGELDAEKNRADAVTRRVNQAAELAAAAVATTINIPGVGDNEIVQVIREYLSGLIEDSPLKDVFATWAARLTPGVAPPDAARLVVPDPANLELAATTALAQERTDAGLIDPGIIDPGAPGESAVAVAVDLADQGRLVAKGSTSCLACAPPADTGDQPNQDPNDNPVEPHAPLVP